EECSGGERCFQVTLRAAKKHASHSPRLTIPTARATKPFRPTKTQHILPATVLSGKRILKLLHRLRILLHIGGHYIWYQRESSAYPDYLMLTKIQPPQGHPNSQFVREPVRPQVTHRKFNHVPTRIAQPSYQKLQEAVISVRKHA